MSSSLDVEVHCSIDDNDSLSSGENVRLFSQAELVAALPSKHTLAVLDSAHGSGSTLRRRRHPDGYASISNIHLGRFSSDQLDNDGEVCSERDTLQRLEHVRSITSSIHIKRKARSQLLSAPRTRLTGYEKWKYERSREWERSKRSFREFLDAFNIWTGSFKTIEGSFGSSVVSYFQFIKWLFLLNIFTTVCVLGGVILPQALLKPEHFPETIFSGNLSVPMPPSQQAALMCSQNYSETVAAASRTNVDSVIIDIFQGTGIVENTYVFIGFYFNKTRFYEKMDFSYDMPLAYLLVTGGYLFVTLILMVRYTAQGVKEKLLSKGDKFYKSSCLVFCGWDYNLNQVKAGTYKHVSLEHEIMSELSAQKRAELRSMMSTNRRVKMNLKRAIIHLITMTCLVGSGALIYFVGEVWKPALLEQENVINSDFLTLMVEYLPSFTITILNFIMPFIFTKLVVFEDYSPAVELKMTITRMAFLRLASLVILALTMLRLISCDEEEMTCGSCNPRTIKCWETYVGQELYKLVILDLVVVFITTFLIEFPRKLIVKHVDRLKIFHQEFDLPKNVLNIVYTQSLSWWGGFYSPVIPAITVFKLFMFFYCKKVSLMVNQKPPSRPYRASKSNHFFMVVLMISFTMSAMAITYTVGRVTPSQGCSPFRVHISPEYMMFNTITDAVKTLTKVPQNFFYFVTSWACYIILFIILILTIYYQTAKSAGSKRAVQLLEKQLQDTEKDKQFLLKQVNAALQQ